MNFFTADLHFGHANIIKYCQRPFTSVEEMDRTLIANWNAKVGADDDVWILGDFTMRSAEHAKGYLRQLAGRKHLILGNHDNFATNANGAALLTEVVPYKELKLEHGQQAVLCHYPMLFWNNSRHGALMLYGHIHNGAYSNAVTDLIYNALNVGVDCCDYAPLSEHEVLTRIAAHNAQLRFSLNDGAAPLPQATLERLRAGICD